MTPREQQAPVWLPALMATLLVGVALSTWLWSGGSPADYLAYGVPEGQLLYLASKLAALLALILMSLQVALGLSGCVRSRARPSMFLLHRALGMATLVAAVMHAALFAIAASLRNKAPMFSLFWPDFSHGYYRSMIAIGALALIGLLTAAAAGFLQRRFGTFARIVHRVAIVVYVLVLIHSLTIGSESRMGLMPFAYGLLGMLLAAALAYRLSGRQMSVG